MPHRTVTIAISERVNWLNLIELLPPRPDWMDSAVCAQTDPELFYPDKGEPAYDAKRVCALCPVRIECLLYALTNREPYGIWGGLTARERHHLTHSTNEGRDVA